MNTSGAKVFLLEDEEDLVFLLRQNLSQAGYQVRACGALAEARALLGEEDQDLLLLDVNLPDGKGFDLLSELRQRQVWTPAIFLTARAEESDRLLGFAVGGDDYVIKPFSMAELLARVAAIVRRGQRPQANQSSCQAFEVDFQRFRLTPRGGASCPLTYLESELLRYLVQRPGASIGRAELLNKVWGYERYPTTRTVDTHVLNLRRKLEPDPSQPRHLMTVHGIGYKFLP